MGTRWKGKDAESKAIADPMSKIVSKLQSSLLQSESCGIFTGSSILLEARDDQIELLTRSCFGQPMVIAEQNQTHWFQLTLEEGFYLCHHLKCIKISINGRFIVDTEFWKLTKFKESFPAYYKAYSHLRMKNWVVRSGSQYGVDFVVYRHHPSLVHSEYAAIVYSEEGGANARLKVWSDLLGTVRLCGSVAKTLLVVKVGTNGPGYAPLPSFLESFSVDEYIIRRWSPEQCREGENQPIDMPL